ncbi:hypothetical protein [Paraburkholderia sp. GAS448]|uniref:hypothetical protein n=1 Tax=Paraburkholderia sp. GAS448 TaxID=3035136 RepID=UPI003D1F171C
MDRHVVDDNIAHRRAEERGQFLIDPNHQIAAFEILKIAHLHVGLRGQIGCLEHERMDRGTLDIPDKEHVAWSELKDSSRLHGTGWP